MSGILSIAREVLSIFFPNQVPQRSLFWNCVIIAFVISASILWFIEHRKLIDLANELKNSKEQNKPNFSLSVDNTIIGSNQKSGGALILISLGIKNIGSPSIAYHWSLSLKSPSFITDRVLPTLIPDGFELKDRDGKRLVARFHKNNNIVERALTPIQQGAYLAGWLRFEFPKYISEQIYESTITLYVNDVFEKEYSIVFKPQTGIEEPIGSKYVPGSGDIPFLIPDERDKP